MLQVTTLHPVPLLWSIWDADSPKSLQNPQKKHCVTQSPDAVQPSGKKLYYWIYVWISSFQKQGDAVFLRYNINYRRSHYKILHLNDERVFRLKEIPPRTIKNISCLNTLRIWDMWYYLSIINLPSNLKGKGDNRVMFLKSKLLIREVGAGVVNKVQDKQFYDPKCLRIVHSKVPQH